MMEALAMFKEVKSTEPPQQVIVAGTPSNSTIKHGLTVSEVVDKLFLLKKDLKEATRLSYEKTAKEFSDFLKNPLVYEILPSDITRYQEHLASEHKIGKTTKKANSTRTIDNKISVLRTVFNFAIKQGYSNSANPAENRQLISNKKRKEASGYAIFDTNEIRKIYWSREIADSKMKDPDFYWTLMLGLHTGCRISEITGLKAEQFKVSDSLGIPYIEIYDSKTSAGKRLVPIPQKLLDSGLADFIKGKDQVFKYTLRLGKGSGNAVGKKFKRLLEKLEITREKLVFHSLRKFVNNFLKQKGVAYEVRCQFIGHEVEDINNRVYAHDFNVEDLAKLLEPLQADWERLSGLVLNNF
jgi:integrase